MNHLMIDIETLSTQPNAVICAIGAAFFEPSTGKIGPSFYQTIDPRTSQNRGAHISADTVMWWLRQDKEPISELVGAKSHEIEVMLDFAKFIEGAFPETKKKNLKVWCKGGSFDFPILKSAFERSSLEGVSMLPWLYWNECCFRSLLTVAGVIGYAPPSAPLSCTQRLNRRHLSGRAGLRDLAAPDLPTHRIAMRAAMHPRLSVICSAPLPVCNRALAALKCFARGQRNFSRVMPHAYLVIRIGRRWRLLSKNGGQQWRLMTHETYNQEYRK
ncbi:exodeoxyribonuclease VIII [Klebsiella pneumoniae]|nr:exodeoxyribonuclease VIII [Klebsiella pneumoniae]